MHVPLHLLELQVAVGNQGDTERTGLTLSCTTCGERMACFSARSQAASSICQPKKTALIAVVVVRLQDKRRSRQRDQVGRPNGRNAISDLCLSRHGNQAGASPGTALGISLR